ncbi:MAG: DCC1-like thiol-disulfide oxidoreductase family protein [Nocardioides sp.]
MLIYDGDCGFCVRSLGWGLRLGITCRHQPWQATDLAALGLTEGDVTTAAWFVRGEEKWAGHLAVAAALRTSRYRVVRALGRVAGRRLLERPLAACYAWIARHRHELPGRASACQMPSPNG